MPQVAHLAESLRVQIVSEDLANLHHSQSGARIEHICRGIAVRLELSTVFFLQRERQTSNVDAGFDLLFLGTSDVGRGRNLLVGGSGEC